MQRWSKRCHCLGNFEILWCWQVTTDKRHLTSDNWRTWTSIMLDSQHCQLLVARFAISHSAQLFDFSLGLNSTLTSSDKLDLLENISVTLSYQIVWADLVCTAKKGRDFVRSHLYCSRLFCIHVWCFISQGSRNNAAVPGPKQWINLKIDSVRGSHTVLTKGFFKYPI